MTRALACLACALCVVATVLAAADDVAPFIPVTADELPEEFRDAPAVMLEDTRTWDLVPSRRATFKVRRRLLVLERRGFRFADQHVSYDKREGEIESFYARTILPDGEIIPVPEDLRNELVTYKDEDHEWRSLHFTFPKMRVGAVLEWGYTIFEKDPGVMKWWEVQGEIPVIEARFHMSAHQSHHYSPPRANAYTRVDHEDRCKVLQKDFHPRGSEFEMLCQDVPALVSETNSPPTEDTSIKFIIDSSRQGFDVITWNAKSLGWGRLVDSYIQKRRAVAALAAELTDDNMSDEEKLNEIYGFIKREMEVRSVYYAPRQRGKQSTFESVDEMLASGGGLPPEITMLTLALLRESGVQAWPVLVHDRTAGRFVPGFPDLSQASHMMLRVNVGEGQPLLDPSCRHCGAGMPDWRYCDGQANALTIGAIGTPFKVGTIPATHSAEIREEHVTLAIDGTAEVEGTVTWTGHSEVDLRREWDGLSESERTDAFHSTLVGDVSEVTIEASDPEEFFEHLSASYQLQRHDLPPLPDGTLLVRPPDVFTPKLPVPMQEDRVNPLWLPYPYSAESKIVFKLPEGYTIEDLPPKGESVFGTGMMFKHRWNKGPRPDEVTWKGQLTVGRTDIGAKHYGEAREFAQRLRHVLRGGVVARVKGAKR